MGDLKTQLAQDGPLDPARAVEVVRQVAAAIDDTRRTVHRDVSVATILLADDGSAYLADAGGTTPSADRTRALVTDTEATNRADVQALTGVLYECLTGHPPNAEAAPPSRQRPGVPVGFDAVIARGLAANPDDRYRSAAELADAAQRALENAVTQTINLPPTPPRPNPPPPQWNFAPGRTVSYPHTRPTVLPPPPRRRRRIAPVIAVVAIVVAVVVGAIAIPKLVHHSGRSASPTPTTSSSNSPKRTYTALPTALPFPELGVTKSVGVDGAGNVYVLASLITDGPFGSAPTQLFKLAPGAGDATAVDLPGVNLRAASDLEVDPAGNIYYSEGTRVWVLEAGKPSPMRLQFRGFTSIEAITFDSAGNVYAVGALLSRTLEFKYGVKKLAPGENRPTDLSFNDLYVPRSITVDNAGNVYVSSGIKDTGHGKISKLAPGATTPTVLPIPELLEPRQVAFDSAGNMFITDGFARKFYELPAGGGNTISIPIPASARGVAVDAADNLYLLTSDVADQSGKITQPGQVLKVVPEK